MQKKENKCYCLCKKVKKMSNQDALDEAISDLSSMFQRQKMPVPDNAEFVEEVRAYALPFCTGDTAEAQLADYCLQLAHRLEAAERERDELAKLEVGLRATRQIQTDNAYENLLRAEAAEAEAARLREMAATNSGTLTRVLAQERRLCETLDNIGRWLGHPAEATELDVQEVIAVIENVRRGSPAALSE